MMGAWCSCKQQNSIICRKIDGNGNLHFQQNKQDSKRQILHVHSPLWNQKRWQNYRKVAIRQKREQKEKGMRCQHR